MATHLDLENAMIKALEKQYKQDKAVSFESRYFAAKTKLFEDILPYIKNNEPNLSDHSNDHIENVLNNAYKLICGEIEESQNVEKSEIDGLNLYFLCQVCLFHDVGNFFGRKKHNENIAKVLIQAFGDLFSGIHSREKRLIAEAGRAHTGKNGDDTLSQLFSRSEHIQGDHLHYCSIAAIVRFADELAEGPQRTSMFMQEHGKYSEDSKIYHKYASCTHIKIDSINQRVSVSYEFNIKPEGRTKEVIDNELRELLEFTYKRISKLDQERKYFNYYNKISIPIRETQINFNFQKDDFDINFKVSPLILNDLIVPAGVDSLILNNRDDLKIETMVEAISTAILSE